jgi:hypothetical protein
MNDSGLVGRRQRAGDLRRDFEHLSEFHWRVSHLLAQRQAFDELSRNEVTGTRIVNLVDGQNVWVIERRRSLRLLGETSHPVWLPASSATESLPQLYDQLRDAPGTSPIPPSPIFDGFQNVRVLYRV